MTWDNTFATDQPTDPFALTRNNDRKNLAPTLWRFHLWHFIMLSFGPDKDIHIESSFFGRFRPRLMLPIEPRGVTVTWPISKKVKILDIFNFGQRCLGWFWLIEKLFLLAQIDVWMALGLCIVDQSWSGTSSFDTFATDRPTDHFALTRYNDRNRSAPTERPVHL